MAQDLNGGLDSVQTRQTDIHHHQVGTRLLAELHRLGAAVRLADDAEFGVRSRIARRPSRIIL